MMPTDSSTRSEHQPDLSKNIFIPLLNQTPTRTLYHNHRTARTATQRTLLLDPTVPLSTDKTLTEILGTTPPDFSLDKRHNLTVWARPSAEIKAMVATIQNRLREVVGEDQGIWFPPPAALHMTVLEIASGLTADTLRPIVRTLAPHAAEFTSLPAHAPVILDSPTINPDVSGIALSFLPLDDALLRLRAALWDVAAMAGVQPYMRYVLPSAHVTVGRFVERGSGLRMERQAWVALIDSMNEELERWTREWRLERLALRAGLSWYGGGTTLNEECNVPHATN